MLQFLFFWGGGVEGGSCCPDCDDVTARGWSPKPTENTFIIAPLKPPFETPATDT